MNFLSRRALVKGASFAAVLGLASSGIFSHDYVLADDIDDKKKQKKSVDEKLAALREDLNEVDTELADAYLALAETESRIPDAQARLDSARSALEAAKAEDARQARPRKPRRVKSGRPSKVASKRFRSRTRTSRAPLSRRIKARVLPIPRRFS